MIEDFERKRDQWDIWVEHEDLDDELKDVFHELVRQNKTLRDALGRALFHATLRGWATTEDHELAEVHAQMMDAVRIEREVGS